MPLIQQLGVRAVERIFAEVFDAFPNGHVVEKTISAETREVCLEWCQSVSFSASQPPYEAFALFGKLVDFLNTVSESRHDRVIEIAMHPRDVDLGQMEIFRHGFHG